MTHKSTTHLQQLQEGKKSPMSKNDNVVRVTSIPRKSLDAIQTWLTDVAEIVSKALVLRVSCVQSAAFAYPQPAPLVRRRPTLQAPSRTTGRRSSRPWCGSPTFGMMWTTMAPPSDPATRFSL